MRNPGHRIFIYHRLPPFSLWNIIQGEKHIKRTFNLQKKQKQGTGKIKNTVADVLIPALVFLKMISRKKRDFF